MGFNPEIMKNILNFMEPGYHLRSNSGLQRLCVKSVGYRAETVSHEGPKMWTLLSEECREIDYLSIFKRKISN